MRGWVLAPRHPFLWWSAGFLTLQWVVTRPGDTYRDEQATYPIDRTTELSKPVRQPEGDADPPPF